MPYIVIDYSDGQYYVKELTEDEADNGMQQGQDFAYVTDSTMAAWKAHCQQTDAFHTLWRTLDNELEYKKRQAVPSADAQKVARLEAELTQARKTSDHYHNLWLKETRRK